MSTPGVGGPLSKVLFSNARRGVLGLLYGHPDQAYYLREIASVTGLAVGQVQREVRQLTDAGLIRRTARGRHVWFQADDRCPIYNEMRSVITKTIGAAAVLADALDLLAERMVAAFIFGSVARGQQTQVSDVDLMVVGEVSFGDVVKAIRPSEQRLRRPIAATVYPPTEFASKLASGHHFLTTVMNAEKIFLIGNQHELDKLLEQRVDPRA